MLVYVLICLSLALAGVAGLQLTYMAYLDRLDRMRKQRLRELERKCRSLTSKLAAAQQRLEDQEQMIGSLRSIYQADEQWADIIDER